MTRNGCPLSSIFLTLTHKADFTPPPSEKEFFNSIGGKRTFAAGSTNDRIGAENRLTTFRDRIENAEV